MQHVIQFCIPQILPNFGLGNPILIHVKDFSFWEKRPTFANFWKQILNNLTFIIGFNKVPSRTQPEISPCAWHVHKELLQKQFGLIGGHVSKWIFPPLWRHSVFEMAPIFFRVLSVIPGGYPPCIIWNQNQRRSLCSVKPLGFDAHPDKLEKAYCHIHITIWHNCEVANIDLLCHSIKLPCAMSQFCRTKVQEKFLPPGKSLRRSFYVSDWSPAVLARKNRWIWWVIH